ncbi:hypothetical protein GE253_10580 [Niveispirillum sp. SYP-B3756]|uniref:hypothetical protein n=1 Tax=Niveispirillum sp. SYP-B3756 TaxID=2662178 RepID=UPI0012910BFF|nr:hypothetical protein [Niveispirillum sp. SYP-B3756]MQP65786.1 hypothetical protein [Niveispirillum sp. SYP-B3756]
MIAPSGARILTGEAKEKASAESEAFTKAHAHLGAADYIKAMMENSESKSSEMLASGFATTSIKVRFQDHIYNLAGTPLDLSKLSMSREAPTDVQQVENIPLHENVQAELLSFQEMGGDNAQTATSLDLPATQIRTLSRADLSFNLLNDRLRQVG